MDLDEADPDCVEGNELGIPTFSALMASTTTVMAPWTWDDVKHLTMLNSQAAK